MPRDQLLLERTANVKGFIKTDRKLEFLFYFKL